MALLIFSKTTDYRHESIAAGVEALRAIAREHGMEAIATEDASVFCERVLDRVRATVWLSTSGDVLAPEERAHFRTFIERGGAYVGVHAASATELDWPFYTALVGARFVGHPEPQQARLRIEDHAHPATAHLGAEWIRHDEWYEFDRNPRRDVRVLVSVDESSYSGGRMGDHPLAWCHELGQARAFYTALGHSAADYADPTFYAHLSGAVSWALGADAR